MMLSKKLFESTLPTGAAVLLAVIRCSSGCVVRVATPPPPPPPRVYVTAAAASATDL